MDAAVPGRELEHFRALPPDAQRDAIVRLSRRGFGLDTIAQATRLSREAAAAVLGASKALAGS